MLIILYYSNYCEHSKKILYKLSKNNDIDIKYICIDRRILLPNGSINIILENGEKVLLPPGINSVPSILLMNEKNREIVGGYNNILNPFISVWFVNIIFLLSGLFIYLRART